MSCAAATGLLVSGWPGNVAKVEFKMYVAPGGTAALTSVHHQLQAALRMEWGNQVPLALPHETLLAIIESHQVLAFVSLSLHRKWRHHHNLSRARGPSGSSRGHIRTARDQCAPCWVEGHAHAISTGKRRHGHRSRFTHVYSSRSDNPGRFRSPGLRATRATRTMRALRARRALASIPFPIYRHAGGGHLANDEVHAGRYGVDKDGDRVAAVLQRTVAMLREASHQARIGIVGRRHRHDMLPALLRADHDGVGHPVKKATPRGQPASARGRLATPRGEQS